MDKDLFDQMNEEFRTMTPEDMAVSLSLSQDEFQAVLLALDGKYMEALLILNTKGKSVLHDARVKLLKANESRLETYQATRRLLEDPFALGAMLEIGEKIIEQLEGEDHGD